jgi:hypothetical protein
MPFTPGGFLKCEEGAARQQAGTGPPHVTGRLLFFKLPLDKNMPIMYTKLIRFENFFSIFRGDVTH